MARKRPMTLKKLAEKIAASLFVNGDSRQAIQLKLIDQFGNDLGGWGRAAVAHHVYGILEEGLIRNKPTTPTRSHGDERRTTEFRGDM